MSNLHEIETHIQQAFVTGARTTHGVLVKLKNLLLEKNIGFVQVAKEEINQIIKKEIDVCNLTINSIETKLDENPELRRIFDETNHAITLLEGYLSNHSPEAPADTVTPEAPVQTPEVQTPETANAVVNDEHTGDVNATKEETSSDTNAQNTNNQQ